MLIPLRAWIPDDASKPLAYTVWLTSEWGPYPVRIVYSSKFKRDKWRIEYGVGRHTYLGGARTSYAAMKLCERLGWWVGFD